MLSASHDLVSSCIVSVANGVADVTSHGSLVHLVHMERSEALRTDDGCPKLVLVDDRDIDAMVVEDM